MQFNDKQQLAIDSIYGNYIVISSAGSGKTTVLVNRIKKMIEDNHILPCNILNVTYTKNGANEMEKRLGKANIDFSGMFIGTIHKFALYQLIMNNTEYKDFNKTHKVCPEWFKKQFMEDAEKNLPKHIEGLNSVEISEYIDEFQNRMLYTDSTIEEFKELFPKLSKNRLSALIDIYKTYELKLKSKKYIDFNSMTLECYRMINTNKVLLDKLRNQYKFIVVDEGQDTNICSHAIIRLLTETNDNTMIVGDHRQNIFSYAYADCKSFFNFANKDNVTLIEMEYNYRSTPEIIDITNRLIQKSTETMYDRFLDVKRVRDSVGINAKVIASKSPIDNAYRIMDIIKEKISQGYKYSDIAILYRTNSESCELECVFNANDIPNIIVNGKSFFDRTEISVFIDYLRLLVNLDGDDAYLNTINKPSRFLGKVFVDQIKRIANRDDSSLLQAHLVADGLKAQWKYGKMNAYEKIILDMNRLSKTVNASELCERLYNDLDYGKYLENISNSKEELETKKENILTLISLSDEFDFAYQFLEYIEDLIAENKKMEKESKEKEVDAVKLMTVYKSKGLEFKVIIVTNVTHDNIPYRRGSDIESNTLLTKAQVEEERRVLFVAMTRAETELYMTFLKFNHKKEPTQYSQFLMDLFDSYDLERLKKGEINCLEYQSE